MEKTVRILLRTVLPLAAAAFLLCSVGCRKRSGTETPLSSPSPVLSSPQPPPETPAVTEAPLPQASSFEIRFLDVGQGDATLVLCDGRSLLIDGGGKAYSSFMYSYLKSTMGLKKLDYVINTHPHEDHVGGLAGALNACPADTVYLLTMSYNTAGFRNFLRYAKEEGLLVPSCGDAFLLGSARVTFMTPKQWYEDMNGRSLTVRIEYGNTSFLIMADATTETEKAMLKRWSALKTDVLRVGHHGSSTSTSYAFLRRTMPEYAVISVGENDYRHPSPNVLSRLSDCGAVIFRTDECGTILFRSDGKNLSYELEKSPDAVSASPIENAA